MVVAAWQWRFREPIFRTELTGRHNLELDPRFQLNFNTAFASGPARLHGVAFK